MKKKKLLIASDSFLPRWDGVARFLAEIIPRLSRTYDITVLVPKFKGKLKELNAKIIRFPLLNIQFGDIWFAKPNSKEIKKLIKETDLIWTQTIGPIGLATIHHASKLKKPIIAYTHSIEWELTSNAVKRFKWLTKVLTKKVAKKYYNKCKLLLVPSKDTAVTLKKAKIKTMKTIVKLGTNISKFKPPENKEIAKEKVGIDPKNIVIGFCGRIGREKDLTTLYRAFNKLKEKYKNLFLLIIGEGVKEQIKIFKDKPNIKLIGATNDVIQYLQAMDIYVLPSLTETTSLSTLEAMSCSLPVIVTKVGYIKQYIKNKVNGMFFPMRNDYVLRKKIQMLIEDPDLRYNLGNNARNTVINRFNWENTVAKIEKALEMF